MRTFSYFIGGNLKNLYPKNMKPIAGIRNGKGADLFAERTGYAIKLLDDRFAWSCTEEENHFTTI